MSPPSRRARAAALCATAALSLLGVASAEATASPSSEVRDAFSRLVKNTSLLPARDARARRALLRTARAAQRASRRSPCRARRLMRAYSRGLRRVRRRAPPTTRRLREGRRRKRQVTTRGQLEARLVAVNAALLAHPRARRCGGARRAPATEVKATLLSSDPQGMTMRVTMPQAHFAQRRFAGRDWSELAMEGLAPLGEPGDPGVPGLTERFGVPTGANVSVRVSNVSSYTLTGVNLLPEQRQPVDQANAKPPEPQFFDKRFTIDRRLYRRRSAFPARVGDDAPIGSMRDLRVGGAELAGAQYSPRRRSLRVITGMDVRITFGGDNRGTFGDRRVNDPFNATFDRIYGSTLKNYSTIVDHLGPEVFDFCGEEVLIITSSALRPAAETLRTQKLAEGFVTRIVETGSGGAGSTPGEIQSFIRNRLNGGCWIRPSYVILIGNTDHVPTFIVPCVIGTSPEDCDVASDLPYSLQDDSDFFADTALGRIPAPDLTTAQRVVDKIVGYETTAPAPPGNDFYRHQTVTSYFEPSHHCALNKGESGVPNCDPARPPVTGHWEVDVGQRRDARTFTQVAEQVRNAMRDEGHTVDRLYVAREDATPEEFWDGTPMPSAIRKPGFAWNATGTDFENAINGGRNIVFHRDHGNDDGWYDPPLTNGQLPFLTNGSELPVAFAVNCASFRFDVPTDPSFGERLLQKEGGGAVGVFGDSRDSPSWPNSDLARGFFDALFPDLKPAYGASDPLQRMGDVLLAGKQYLHTVDPGASYIEGHLYGYFGDPTMGLWIDDPVPFDPARVRAVTRREPFPGPRPPGPGPDPPPYWIEVIVEQPGAEGTLVTAEQKGETIGRGVVRNGRALIVPYNSQVQTTAGSTVRLQQENFFAHTEPVEGQ